MKTVLRSFLILLLGAGIAAAQGAAPSGIRAGSTLPDVSGVDLQGNPARLVEVAEDTTVVLSFWSVHCRDCIRELDDLRAIRGDFPPGEVTVVAVNTDSGLPVERIAGFVRRYESARGPLGVEHLLDRDASVVESLGVTYIPVLVVADRSGRVTSVLTGYGPDDRARVSQALEDGRVALGAWSEGFRGRLRTVLRSPGPGGGTVEWGSFRVEDGMSLFGVHDAEGWLFDAAGRRDRATEARRIEAVVADRLKLLLLREALGSMGVRLPDFADRAQLEKGLVIPESPFAGEGRWRALYEVIRFDELYRAEERLGEWFGDEYWAGLVGDVDLGALRRRLQVLDFPTEPRRIRVQTVSDFDFKPRAVMGDLRDRSYRLRQIQGEHLVYYGTPSQLADELRGVSGTGVQVYVELLGADEVRVEVY